MKNVFFTPQDTAKRIQFLEDQLQSLNQGLNNFFIKGRLRTERAAPANSADVGSGDMLYDMVITTTYLYTLVNDGGNLRWRRVAINSF